MKHTSKVIATFLIALALCLTASITHSQSAFTETVQDSNGNKILTTYAYDSTTENYIGNTSVFVRDANENLIKIFEKDSNGRVQGCYIEYYSNGMVKKKANYRDGFRSGVYTEYYSNGKLKLQGQYQEQLSDDEKQRLCNEYSQENLETGELETSIQCDDGMKEASWSFFNKSGHLIKTQIWVLGELKEEVLMEDD
jgi:antitoxin component YwqK of YwqJK toxin-antitoxin module